MYRGHWRSSDVAIKTLHPHMLGVQYASRQAWVDFLTEANRMGRMRHQNLVEVQCGAVQHQ